MPWGSDHIFWISVAALMGACIGSFLNVVIYRVPRDMKVSEPKRSFCPGCKKDIPWQWNIPIVSWLLLRGKCRGCGGKIAFHYVAVEILTAVAFAWAWWAFPPAEAVLLWVFLALVIPITWIDAEHMIIPTQLTWGGTVVGLLGSVLAGGVVMLTAGDEPLWWMRLLQSGLGWVAGFAALGAVVLLGKVLFGRQKQSFEEATPWFLKEPKTEVEELQFVIDDEGIDWGEMFYRKTDTLRLTGHGLKIDGQAVPCTEVSITADEIRAVDQVWKIEDIKSAEGKVTEVTIPREAMGSGDPHLLAMIGAFLGWQSILFVVMGSCVTALTAAVFARVGLGKALPYGPFLIAGAMIWLAGGSEWWETYFEWTRQR